MADFLQQPRRDDHAVNGAGELETFVLLLQKRALFLESRQLCLLGVDFLGPRTGFEQTQGRGGVGVVLLPPGQFTLELKDADHLPFALLRLGLL